MKKIFIAVIFVFVCLISIFFCQYYRKLSLAPVPNIKERVQGSFLQLSQEPYRALDKDSVPEPALEPDMAFDKDLALTQEFQAMAQDRVSPLATNKDLVPDQESAPTLVLVQEPNAALDKDSVLALDSSLQLPQKSDTALDKDLELVQESPVFAPEIVSTKSGQRQEESDTQETEKNKKEIRTIKVKNNITTDMLKYKHWTGTYSPTFFKVSIDNNELEMGQEHAIPIENNRLVVSYQYSFMNGYKKGHRAVTFDVDKDVSMVNLTFSWKTKWHILSKEALPIEVEEVIEK